MFFTNLKALFKDFKFYYKDFDEYDSTSRLINGWRPLILGLTVISCVVLFEENSTAMDKEKTWFSRLYVSKKQKINAFFLRFNDIIEIE